MNPARNDPLVFNMFNNGIIFTPEQNGSAVEQLSSLLMLIFTGYSIPMNFLLSVVINKLPAVHFLIPDRFEFRSGFPLRKCVLHGKRVTHIKEKLNVLYHSPEVHIG